MYLVIIPKTFIREFSFFPFIDSLPAACRSAPVPFESSLPKSVPQRPLDASQGVEAQTLANVYLALDEELEIVPVLNKIDLPSARPDEIKLEIEDVIGIEATEAPLISAKEGIS